MQGRLGLLCGLQLAEDNLAPDRRLPHLLTSGPGTPPATPTPRPASRTFTVDTAPPDTTIDSGPAGTTNDPTPTFGFSSEAGASFQCKVDSGSYAACSSPKTTSLLTDGSHTFHVRARDAAGNPDPTPASRTFTVDTTPPDTTIDSGPAGTTNDPTPTFGFSSEAGASFQCKVDSGSYAACSSPKTTSFLTDGSHTFSVRAKDEVGNVEAAPALRSFTVRTASVSVSGLTLVVTAASGAEDNLAVTQAVPLDPAGHRPPRWRRLLGSGVDAGPGCTQNGDYTAECAG